MSAFGIRLDLLGQYIIASRRNSLDGNAEDPDIAAARRRDWCFGMIGVNEQRELHRGRLMARKSTVVENAIEAEGPHSDGRRERSRTSRGKIIRAMMDLIATGHNDPSAARVAEKAGVGLRTVFRHFDDKDSIFREMDQILNDAYLPALLEPYQADNWKDQLVELVERRAKVFEAIAPFRISTSLQRFNSKVLMENYKRLLKGERKRLFAILPQHVRKDEQRSRAIQLATSFDTWRLFRHDEELSRKKTLEVIKQLLQDILDQIPD